MIFTHGHDKFTSIILYMNIICIAQWLFEANSEVLHCSDAFARHHKHCKPQCSFMQTHVDYFYCENMTSFLNYVTDTLRTLYAWHGLYDKRCAKFEKGSSSACMHQQRTVWWNKRTVGINKLPLCSYGTAWSGPSLGILGMGPGPLKLGKIASFWIELGKFQ